MLVGGLLLIAPVLLAAAVLIALGIRGRKVIAHSRPGNPAAAGATQRASNSGLVVVVVVLLAVMCLPTGAAAIVAIGVAAYWLMPFPSQNYDSGPMETPFEDRVSRRPPKKQLCQGPSTWAEIVTCLKKAEPKSTVDPAPTPHTRVVRINGGVNRRLYVQDLGTGKSLKYSARAKMTVDAPPAASPAKQ